MYTVEYTVQHDDRVIGNFVGHFSEQMVEIVKMHGESVSTAIKRQIRGAYKGPTMAGLVVSCKITRPESVQKVAYWQFIPCVPFV